MVVKAAQKGSYSGTSRGVLFRQITVLTIQHRNDKLDLMGTWGKRAQKGKGGANCVL